MARSFFNDIRHHSLKPEYDELGFQVSSADYSLPVGAKGRSDFFTSAAKPAAAARSSDASASKKSTASDQVRPSAPSRIGGGSGAGGGGDGDGGALDSRSRAIDIFRDTINRHTRASNDADYEDDDDDDDDDYEDDYTVSSERGSFQEDDDQPPAAAAAQPARAVHSSSRKSPPVSASKKAKRPPSRRPRKRRSQGEDAVDSLYDGSPPPSPAQSILSRLGHDEAMSDMAQMDTTTRLRMQREQARQRELNVAQLMVDVDPKYRNVSMHVPIADNLFPEGTESIYDVNAEIVARVNATPRSQIDSDNPASLLISMREDRQREELLREAAPIDLARAVKLCTLCGCMPNDLSKSNAGRAAMVIPDDQENAPVSGAAIGEDDDAEPASDYVYSDVQRLLFAYLGKCNPHSLCLLLENYWFFNIFGKSKHPIQVKADEFHTHFFGSPPCVIDSRIINAEAIMTVKIMMDKCSKGSVIRSVTTGDEYLCWRQCGIYLKCVQEMHRLLNWNTQRMNFTAKDIAIGSVSSNPLFFAVKQPRKSGSKEVHQGYTK